MDKSPEFDPIAALEKTGMSPAALPRELAPEEIFPEEDEAPESGPIPDEVVFPQAEETASDTFTGRRVNFDAYRTADHVEAPLPEVDEAKPAPAANSNPKDALGSKKPALLSVIPPAGLLHLGSAMAEGARKYGAFNWRANSVIDTIYADAMLRHLLQWMDGEDFDPESGCHHLGHVMASAAIVLDANSTGNLIHNRPLPGASGKMIRGYTPDVKFNFSS